jgi:hypothetical protein
MHFSNVNVRARLRDDRINDGCTKSFVTKIVEEWVMINLQGVVILVIKLIAYSANFILFLVGGIFMCVSVEMRSSNEKKKQSCKELTRAVVVDMKQESSTSNIDSVATFSWYPIYEYTVNGQTIRKKSYFGQSKQIFYPGQEIELYYNPNDYNEFYVPKEKAEGFVNIFKIIGGVLLVLGVLVFFILKQFKWLG